VAKLLLLALHLGEHLGQQALGALLGQLGAGFLLKLDQAPQRGYPHFKELIKVSREDGQKLEALQQRHGGALRFLQHAGVEAQPAEVTGQGFHSENA
jgi:hypothetical protein